MSKMNQSNGICNHSTKVENSARCSRVQNVQSLNSERKEVNYD